MLNAKIYSHLSGREPSIDSITKSFESIRNNSGDENGARPK